MLFARTRSRTFRYDACATCAVVFVIKPHAYVTHISNLCHAFQRTTKNLPDDKTVYYAQEKLDMNFSYDVCDQYEGETNN